MCAIPVVVPVDVVGVAVVLRVGVVRVDGGGVDAVVVVAIAVL